VEVFEAKYAGKYAEFGEVRGAYMRHISGICKFEWRRIIIIIGFFCTVLTFATSIYSTSNCKYR